MKHSLYAQYQEDLIQGYMTEPEFVHSTFLQMLENLKSKLTHGHLLWPEFLSQVMNCTRENMLALEEAERRGSYLTKH